MLRWLLPAMAAVGLLVSAAHAQEEKPRHFSQCQAIAGNLPGATFARFEPGADSARLQQAAMAD